MKIFVLDHTQDKHCAGSFELVRCFHSFGNVHVRRPSDGDLPSLDCDRIVLSGSITRVPSKEPWVVELKSWLKTAIQKKIPILGLCFGHQILAELLGGKVSASPSPEIGWTPIQAHSELFPETLWSYSYHFDEVKTLPEGAMRIASSKDCENQAFEMNQGKILGLQFHPEKTLEDVQKTYAMMDPALQRRFLNKNQENTLSLEWQKRFFKTYMEKFL